MANEKAPITERIELALRLAPSLKADTAGEILREICFAEEGGCYSTFDLAEGFEPIPPARLKLVVRTALAGCWAKDIPTIRRMHAYVHRDTELLVAWYWDGDGTLVFAKDRLFLYNDDCKCSYGWEESAPGDWIHTYRHYETEGGNYPCDSNSDPQGGDALAAPGEASQSGGAAASPNPSINQETPHAR